MALPLTGPLSMSQVNTELKLTTRGRQSLSSTAVRGLAKISSGRIKFSDLRGRSAKVRITKTFCSSTSWVAPAGVTALVTLTGQGARGEDAYDYLVEAYTGGYAKRWVYADGTQDDEFGGIDFTYGSVPQGGCSGYMSSGWVRQYEECYSYSDASYWESADASTGSSTTAFGRTFPGSHGNTPVSPTTYQNVPVTPGQTYYIYPAYGTCVTFEYDEDVQSAVMGTLTGSGTLAIPAGTTVSLTGTGLRGYQYYEEGQEYIAPSKTLRSSNGHGQYDGLMAAAGTGPTCTDTPGSEGPTNITHTTINGEPFTSWDCPIYDYVGGQDYIEAGWRNARGASVTATLNGTTRTFLGSLGDVAPTSSTQTLTSAGAQNLTYNVPAGASLSYTYTPGK